MSESGWSGIMGEKVEASVHMEPNLPNPHPPPLIYREGNQNKSTFLLKHSHIHPQELFIPSFQDLF